MQSFRFSTFTRCISLIITICFLSTSIVPPVNAQTLNLPLPGTIVPLTNAYLPAILKGVNLHPDNPLRFDFLIDKGDDNLGEDAFKDASQSLIKYFLVALTIPEKEMWVNLSPYEKDRIIPPAFGETEMGRDLLAQDYMLKQLSSSLMYPEDNLGKEFWARVYSKAQAQFGTNDIPLNTFNKIWIIPEDALVFEHERGAFIIKSHLKVMLEEDYLALNKHLQSNAKNENADAKVVSGVTSQAVREILIPEIEKEVNEGKTFAQLRQIYNAVILATWYKNALKESILTQAYADQNKINGIDVNDKAINEKIYNQYVETFKKGVYDYIKEEYDPAKQEVIARKYFSGGSSMDNAALVTRVVQAGDLASLGVADRAELVRTVQREPDILAVTADFTQASDTAMVDDFENPFGTIIRAHKAAVTRQELPDYISSQTLIDDVLSTVSSDTPNKNEEASHALATLRKIGVAIQVGGFRDDEGFLLGVVNQSQLDVSAMEMLIDIERAISARQNRVRIREFLTIERILDIWAHADNAKKGTDDLIDLINLKTIQRFDERVLERFINDLKAKSEEGAIAASSNAAMVTAKATTPETLEAVLTNEVTEVLRDQGWSPGEKYAQGDKWALEVDGRILEYPNLSTFKDSSQEIVRRILAVTPEAKSFNIFMDKEKSTIRIVSSPNAAMLTAVLDRDQKKLILGNLINQFNSVDPKGYLPIETKYTQSETIEFHSGLLEQVKAKFDLEYVLDDNEKPIGFKFRLFDKRFNTTQSLKGLADRVSTWLQQNAEELIKDDAMIVRGNGEKIAITSDLTRVAQSIRNAGFKYDPEGFGYAAFEEDGVNRAPRYGKTMEKAVSIVKTFVKRHFGLDIKEFINDVVIAVIGIGGQTTCVVQADGLIQNKPNHKLVVLDSLGTNYFELEDGWLSVLKRDGKLLTVIGSKSGKTDETMINFQNTLRTQIRVWSRFKHGDDKGREIADNLISILWNKDNPQELAKQKLATLNITDEQKDVLRTIFRNTIFVTGVWDQVKQSGSLLDRMVKEGFLGEINTLTEDEVLEIEMLGNLGGRFQGISPNSLAINALLGLDIDAMLEAGREEAQRQRGSDNYITQKLAHEVIQGGVQHMVIGIPKLSGDRSFKRLAESLGQTVPESLGKGKQEGYKFGVQTFTYEGSRVNEALQFNGKRKFYFIIDVDGEKNVELDPAIERDHIVYRFKMQKVDERSLAQIIQFVEDFTAHVGTIYVAHALQAEIRHNNFKGIDLNDENTLRQIMRGADKGAPNEEALKILHAVFNDITPFRQPGVEMAKGLVAKGGGAKLFNSKAIALKNLPLRDEEERVRFYEAQHAKIMGGPSFAKELTGLRDAKGNYLTGEKAFQLIEQEAQWLTDSLYDSLTPQQKLLVAAIKNAHSKGKAANFVIYEDRNPQTEELKEFLEEMGADRVDFGPAEQHKSRQLTVQGSDVGVEFIIQSIKTFDKVKKTEEPLVADGTVADYLHGLTPSEVRNLYATVYPQVFMQPNVQTETMTLLVPDLTETGNRSNVARFFGEALRVAGDDAMNAVVATQIVPTATYERFVRDGIIPPGTPVKQGADYVEVDLPVAKVMASEMRRILGLVKQASNTISERVLDLSMDPTVHHDSFSRPVTEVLYRLHNINDISLAQQELDNVTTLPPEMKQFLQALIIDDQVETAKAIIARVDSAMADTKSGSQAERFVDDQGFQQQSGSGLYNALPDMDKSKIDLVIAVTQFLEVLTSFSPSEEVFDSIAARKALADHSAILEVMLNYLGGRRSAEKEQEAREVIRKSENAALEYLFERGIRNIINTNIFIQGRKDTDAIAVTFDGERLTGKPDKKELVFIYRPNEAYAFTQMVANSDSNYYKGGIRWGLPIAVDAKGNALKDANGLVMNEEGALRAFLMAYAEANGLSLSQLPKNILAKLPYAGAKTYIGVLLDALSPEHKIDFLTKWGRAAVDIGLIPKYVAGPDVNMSPADMDVIVKAIQMRYIEHLKLELEKLQKFGINPLTFKIEDYNEHVSGREFLSDPYIKEMRKRIVEALNKGRLDLQTLSFDAKLESDILKIIGAGATGGDEQNGGLPHANMAVTGDGVVDGVDRIMQYIKDPKNEEFRKKYRLEPLAAKEKIRVAVDGGGDVGATGALKLLRRGYVVVAIDDINGAVYKTDGFTEAELQNLVNSNPKTRNVVQWMPQGPGVKHLLSSELFDKTKVDIDLLVPAATSGRIHKGNIDQLRGVDDPDVQSGVRSPLVIIEGANISFKDVIPELHKKGILAFNGSGLNFGGVFTSYQQDLLQHRFMPAEMRKISLETPNGIDLIGGGKVNPVVEKVTGRYKGAKQPGALTVTDGKVTESSIIELPVGTLIDVWGAEIYSQGEKLQFEDVSVLRNVSWTIENVEHSVTIDQDGNVQNAEVDAYVRANGGAPGSKLKYVDNMDKIKQDLYMHIKQISQRINTMVIELVNESGMNPTEALVKIARLMEEKKNIVLRDVNKKYKKAIAEIVDKYRRDGYILTENIERNIAAIEIAAEQELEIVVNSHQVTFGTDGTIVKRVEIVSGEPTFNVAMLAVGEIQVALPYQDGYVAIYTTKPKDPEAQIGDPKFLYVFYKEDKTQWAFVSEQKVTDPNALAEFVAENFDQHDQTLVEEVSGRIVADLESKGIDLAMRSVQLDVNNEAVSYSIYAYRKSGSPYLTVNINESEKRKNGSKSSVNVDVPVSDYIPPQLIAEAIGKELLANNQGQTLGVTRITELVQNLDFTPLELAVTSEDPEAVLSAAGATIEVDNAALAQRKKVGGIDLNPALLNLNVKRNGRGIIVPEFPQGNRDLQVEGFVPVIINVQPVLNLPLLLGFADMPDKKTIGYDEKDPIDKRKFFEQAKI